MTLSVSIIGGGIGGLTLAHGLRRRGVNVRVFERDQSKTERLQGYRVHLSPKGCQALHECLPPELYQRFLATTGKSNSSLGFYDKDLRELLVVESEELKTEHDTANYRSVNRMALREVLISDLRESLELGKKFVRYEKLTDGRVRAHFDDGSHADADLLVAADGAGSQVRQQYLPQAPRVDTGAFVISGKVPLTDATMGLLPPQADTGPCMIFGPNGRMGFVAAHRVRDSGHSEGERDLLWDDAADYIMWNIVTTWDGQDHRDTLMAHSPERLLETALSSVAGWSPQLAELLRASDLGTVMIYPFSRATTLEHWPASNVTLLGDAIHCMPPTAGQGANTAIRDAALLRDTIVSVVDGERDLVAAVADYEQRMRGYAYPIVEEAMRNLRGGISKSRVGHAATKSVFRMINRIGPVKRRMARAMTSD
ncbi:FAD-dependent oxidoreductase [Stackebrandtia nassauensis]|uniref:Monooxygenase FAD-binding protein n=1 Tax=Stackebrandtia nassauensis (strain DSM 44728 / CIP 108903 / NRRL B-16338 / NBRC 102104 / LLR-40K-21) TaxID=446470 RepID=D3PYS7_STANL|nr:NAD(P)/FAD-dependent oxidoreductase [Stackebrandtia nassauensis]ADD43510.1 monooxygenase FAD-binding protein [Stackebrandtia nassauensis DSM 44728]